MRKENKREPYRTGRSVFPFYHLPWNCMGRDRWNLILTDKGSCTVANEHGSWQMYEMDMILCAPSLQRSFRTSNAWNSYWFHFDAPAELIRWQKVMEGVYLYHADPLSFPRILSVVQELHQLILSPEKDLLLVENLFMNLILRGNQPLQKNVTETMRQCAEYLTESPLLPRMDLLARKYSMSRAKFYTEFKEVFGMPPHAYFESARFRKVKDLLAATDLSFTEIAHICNFSSLYYLSKRFRSVFGMSLRQYRQKRQKGLLPGKM